MRQFLIIGGVVGAIEGLVGLIAAVDQLQQEHPSKWWIVACVVFAVGVIVALLNIRAGWIGRDANPLPAALAVPAPAPKVPISIRDARISDERSDTTPRRWPLKLRATIQNDSDRPVRLGELEWLTSSKQAQVQTQPPHRFNFYYSIDSGKSEVHELPLPGKAITAFWLALNPDHDKAELDQMLAEHRLGTLVIPVSTGDRIIQAKFPL
jgi:hypothetical protein